jgi:alanine-glyoxylate transaminase/serine-glyoxylate transaminase/serine-pyruvate transaminase
VPEHVDSTDIVRHAYHRYNLSLGGGLTKVKGRVFRIGHLGDMNELMLLTAISGAEMALRDCGVMVEPGSGVAAAQEYYRGVELGQERAAAE